MAIDRTNYNALVDDDGSNTVGTNWTKNIVKTVLLDPIDAFVIGKEELWLPAKMWFPSVSSGCAALATREVAAFQDYEHLAFDGASGEVAITTIALPKRWNLGTITYRVYWSGIVAGAGGVSWTLSGLATSDGDTMGAGAGTAILVNDTFQTEDFTHVTSESAAMTFAGTPVAGDQLRLQLNRSPADAGDTRTQDANMIGVKIYYTTTAPTDA